LNYHALPLNLQGPKYQVRQLSFKNLELQHHDIFEIVNLNL
jgi:hypothetical protein